ncbi:MAG: archaemetzincin [Planctomycetota bacterium]|nr:archaemetzincin [Planctomycetota bacterium]
MSLEGRRSVPAWKTIAVAALAAAFLPASIFALHSAFGPGFGDAGTAKVTGLNDGAEGTGRTGGTESNAGAGTGVAGRTEVLPSPRADGRMRKAPATGTSAAGLEEGAAALPGMSADGAPPMEGGAGEVSGDGGKSRCGKEDDAALVEKLSEIAGRLRPLHVPLGKPGPHDWLARHREPGQTFREYVASRPTLPRGRRTVIFIQPIGGFGKEQWRIVGLTAEYLGICFHLPVRTRDAVPLDSIPARARRVHPAWGDRQILTGYILEEVLKPHLPDDAAACLGLTASDLWPGEGWNFVFGQASLSERVGVWSLYRNGDPAAGEEGFRLYLLRTLKTAAHETGHMFSMLHCTAWECNMCGSNHREESDRRPLWECPECMAKICWAAGAAPAERYRRLAAFCAASGLEKERAFYEKSFKLLEGREK